MYNSQNDVTLKCILQTSSSCVPKLCFKTFLDNIYCMHNYVLNHIQHTPHICCICVLKEWALFFHIMQGVEEDKIFLKMKTVWTKWDEVYCQRTTYFIMSSFLPYSIYSVNLPSTLKLFINTAKCPDFPLIFILRQ